MSGGKATKTGTVLARAQLQPAHGGVIAAQERRTALLAKGMFREAEMLAQVAPVGSLAYGYQGHASEQGEAGDQRCLQGEVRRVDALVARGMKVRRAPASHGEAVKR